MSGLEVVAAVAAIVSGFGSGVILFKQWKEKRARRKEARLSGQKKTEKTLSISGPFVRREYDQDFRRLGNAFAVGDYTCQTQMQMYLITLQQSIISLLGDALGGRSTNISLSQLMETSNSVRTGAVSALSNQFQRMSTAASISGSSRITHYTSPLSAERSRRSQQYCPFALRMQNDYDTPVPYQDPRTYANDVSCPECPWRPVLRTSNRRDVSMRASRLGFWSIRCRAYFGHHSGTRNSTIDLNLGFFLKCHLRPSRDRDWDARPLFGCIFCEEDGTLRNFSDWFEFAKHIAKRHWDEYVNDCNQYSSGTEESSEDSSSEDSSSEDGYVRRRPLERRRRY